VSEQNGSHHKLVIIGSGPAGLTAAIYAARADLEPLVILGQQPGGQLTITTEVENFPGFVEGVMGPELMDTFHRQAERMGTDFLWGTVTSVEMSQRPFTITVDEQYEVTAEALIISSGATAKMLGLESESRLLGRGVSACATCDGAFFRDQKVLVVGGGDTAAEEALFLTKFAKTVTLIHRRDELRASKVMADRLSKHPKVDFMWDTVIEEVLGEDVLTAVRVRNVKTDEVADVECDGCFIAIGHKPNTEFFDDQLETDDEGYLVTKAGHDAATLTSVEGVFACGDVQDPYYRQAVTAAGSGCQAAIDASRWLESLEDPG
jgi:thioredoxin reductase (NADPH)